MIALVYFFVLGVAVGVLATLTVVAVKQRTPRHDFDESFQIAQQRLRRMQ